MCARAHARTRTHARIVRSVQCLMLHESSIPNIAIFFHYRDFIWRKECECIVWLRTCECVRRHGRKGDLFSEVTKRKRRENLAGFRRWCIACLDFIEDATFVLKHKWINHCINERVVFLACEICSSKCLHFGKKERLQKCHFQSPIF